MRDQSDWIKQAVLCRFDEVYAVSDNRDELAKLKQQMMELQATIEKIISTKDKALLRAWSDTQDEYMSKQMQWCYTKGFHDYEC
jgi:uncharacterized membrane protein (DUF106 family)